MVNEIRAGGGAKTADGLLMLVAAEGRLEVRKSVNSATKPSTPSTRGLAADGDLPKASAHRIPKSKMNRTIEVSGALVGVQRDMARPAEGNVFLGARPAGRSVRVTASR